MVFILFSSRRWGLESRSWNMWHAFGMLWGGCGEVSLSCWGGYGGPPPENLKTCMLSGAIWHILGLIFSALTFAIFCFHQWYHVKLSAGKALLLKKSLIQGMAELENEPVQFNPWIRWQLSTVQALAQLSLLLTVCGVITAAAATVTEQQMWVPRTAGITSIVLPFYWFTFLLKIM